MEGEIFNFYQPAPEELLDLLTIDLNAINRTNLLIAYACCDIIIKSKDRGGQYKSVTRFINQLSSCTKIDGLQIRKYSLQDLDILQGILINLIYK